MRSMIDGIKDAAIIVCGGFTVDVTLEGATEHDKVLLQLTKADGTLPSADEVAKLIADAKVAKADAAISKARKALHKEMEGKYTVLRLEGEVLASAAAPATTAHRRAQSRVAPAAASSAAVGPPSTLPGPGPVKQ